MIFSVITLDVNFVYAQPNTIVRFYEPETVTITDASTQRTIFKIGQKVKIGDISGTITAVELSPIVVTNEKMRV